MVAEQPHGIYTDFRIPGIVATEKGTLLRYCECRKTQSDWADIDLKIMRSTDKGATWEQVLLLDGGGNTLNNPVMFVDGEQLLFLYCKNYREIWKCVSTDDGKGFGEPQRVRFEEKVDFFYNVVALGPGHGIVHAGRLIVPMWIAYNKENPKAHRPSFITTFYSDDHGETWNLGERIFEEKLTNPSECALAITAEGEYFISIRHESPQRKRALAVSADGISNWRDFRFAENLSDPVCMGSMTHRDGVIYHSNCDSQEGRVNLTVKISEDCFATHRSIFVSKEAGYSDIALLDDRLCILYEKTIPKEPKGNLPFALYFETIDL